MRRSILAAAGIGALLASTTSFAHVTLEAAKAPSGSTYKATFSMSHGCDGSPTVRLRIRIPDGVTSIKPQPKPGWELTTIKEKRDKPTAGDHGATITEAIREVAWSGGRLLDEHFDQFAMQMKLPDAPNTTIYFPVVQECEKGVNRWIEIPEPGKSAHDYKQPAPALRLTSGAAQH